MSFVKIGSLFFEIIIAILTKKRCSKISKKKAKKGVSKLSLNVCLFLCFFGSMVGEKMNKTSSLELTVSCY